MEFSKLSYDDYIYSMDYWYGVKGVELPLWAEEISDKGCPSVSAIDFYDDIFGEDLEEHRMPEDYVSGEYGGIAIERIPTNDERKFRGKRITVTKGNSQLYDLIDRSNNFCVIAPVSYAGKSRKNENARYLYALTIEIDNIVPNTGINELFYSWQRQYLRMPQPTYIVCSGTGLHLYFVFERPIPLFQNIFERLSEIKKYLTPLFWNKYVTTSYEHDKIQFESVNQPFRCVGTVSKNGKARAMAFSTGNKITIEYLNKFLPKDKQLKEIYKSQVSLEKSKELYPEWYQRRIVEGKGRGHWTRYEGIYYNWIEKIKSGAVVGHRYNCLENLCSLAVQCNISPEQVEKDCWDLVPFLDGLTESEDNHFNEYDVICALKTYNNAEETAYRRKIEYISNRTGIQLTANKRNGRKQNVHLMGARAIQEINDKVNGTNWREGNGRKLKKDIVQNWKKEHPNGKKSECIRDTGLSKPTVYKWWNLDD